ncbi:MAG: hypothetical protein KME45_22095 [Stenomitos rutilans HA7619-LM2]|jgi:hypothetical protein|nr:hypothetical protein [Stenomitos rutilans HA7619-LM2]
MKKIIQTYKAGKQWQHNPPGLGDFIRGTCHLFERLEATGCELRVDVSQTDFSTLIEFDPSFFHLGEAHNIATAQEFFETHEHQEMYAQVDRFLNSQEEELYLCTNLGDWNRTSLPAATRAFAKKFYCFNESVTRSIAEKLTKPEYEVLSIRAGDQFIGKADGAVDDALKQRVFQIIEKKILPRSTFPIVVMSDSYELKCELADRYHCIMFSHVPQHGAYGNALPVAIDMQLLQHSEFNYHINAWQPWWSGFSHYTSLIFLIPSINFRSPAFIKEEITRSGNLRVSFEDKLLSKLKRLKDGFSL